MEDYFLQEVVGFIEQLNYQDHTRLQRTRKFFEEYGFQIGPKYLKKITGNIWELRAGNIRLFLCIQKGTAIGVHIIIKKTQKLHKRDIDLVVKRCETYEITE